MAEFSTDALRQVLAEYGEGVDLNLQPSVIITTARRRRTMNRASWIGGTAAVAVASATCLAWFNPPSTTPDITVPESSPSASPRYQDGALAPLHCDPGNDIEISSPGLSDGSLDDLQPLDRVELLLKGEFIRSPSGQVIVDSSRLSESSGIVLIGSDADGTVASVQFVRVDQSWSVGDISQCVPPGTEEADAT